MLANRKPGTHNASSPHLTQAFALATLLLLAPMMRSSAEWPDAEWAPATPAELRMDEQKLAQAREYALTGGGAGCVIRHGRLAWSWGDVRERFDLKSTTKSFGSIALGLAIGDGVVQLHDKARRHHPTFGVPPESNAQIGWRDEITLVHLATHTAGFEKPGGFAQLLFAPGTRWRYSDGGPNWLAECLTLAWRRDVAEVMASRVFEPLNITRDDLTWRKNQYRPATIDGIARREFGSGISANVNALSRIGYLMLREGVWKEDRILPRDYVTAAGKPAPGLPGLEVEEAGEHGTASSHYGLLWWNNGDQTIKGVPRDAYWSWGLHDSLIVVIPSLDLVAARAGKSWKRTNGAEHYAVLKPFLQPIAAAASPAARERSGPAYPPSPVILEIKWAPKETILRTAKGSDNWPMTWADDDALYTAFGDGRGFEPYTKQKLSLGLAKVTGSPPELTGTNIAAPGAEAFGEGKHGRKASGILMVDGVLYLLVRNAGNAQLGWSGDHGATWSWAEWKFTESFGCPTFLNFGRNYAGARDAFVYVYSHDSDSAYERADRFVLARVPRDKLRERDAYEFFVGADAAGQPVWSKDMAQRGAVFTNPGACYRSGISYHAGLKRYLWCQIGTAPEPRFAGGFAIYDAPEPWGPWTTVFYTDTWDVGPGETNSLPTKWMSADGLTVHLMSSTDDYFSVRRGELVRRPGK